MREGGEKVPIHVYKYYIHVYKYIYMYFFFGGGVVFYGGGDAPERKLFLKFSFFWVEWGFVD